MKRRRAEESADGLALMTSSVTSSQSADGLSPAVARYQQSTRYPDARKAKVAKLGNQTQATAHSVESFYEPAVAPFIQSQRSRRKIPVTVFEDSAEAQSSSRHETAAKQLTIYKSWMSTAERNSNGKNAEDGKNQWLRLSRANCLNSREQDLYYSGKYAGYLFDPIFGPILLKCTGFRNEEEYQQEEAYCAKKIAKNISSYICSADGLTRLSSAVGLSTRYPDARKAKVAKLGNQTQATAHSVESFYEPAVAPFIQSQRSRRKIPVAVFEDSAEAQSSSRHESAAKQLTIYESWMSTAERNSNGKNAQDGKNQWLRLSRANCLNLREQDLYYSGK
ncbi:hypothetical protein F511_30592 [Dorcoceras hygrometricum]|uniref:Uncharacterized protein n=1 Tax=Dorcoceras hygrometricum TaxID=472368 RepID=A0A2Z7BQM1_9LAMI|nr:hypothetical protein F511_30592 [Dorcoceras hygrometricum]